MEEDRKWKRSNSGEQNENEKKNEKNVKHNPGKWVK